MLYIINGHIHFRNTDGALWKEDENDPSSITLTATTSRLLTFLLDHHGEVISRDDILDTVWVRHGLRSSNNSLNKYIADLRKVFGNFEMPDEVIITVPKIGFMFARDIDVVKEKLIFELDKHNAKADSERNEIDDNKSSMKNIYSKKWILVALGVIVIGLIPLLMSKKLAEFDIFGLSSINERTYYLLGDFNKCEIYTINQSSTEMTTVKLAIAKSFMKKTGLHCIENTRIFFQPSDSVAYGYPGRVFISRCTLNKDHPNKFAACDNYYGASYIND